MRDPKRIDEFCSALAEIWHIVPDWRFGQLMLNAFSMHERCTGRDVFYLEDDKMIKFLKECFGQEDDV